MPEEIAARPPLRPGVEPDDSDRGAEKHRRRRDGGAGSEPTPCHRLSGKLLPIAFPNAELVDGELAMRTARRIKTAEEVEALRGATRVAEAGLTAAVSELSPGITEQSLTGAMLEAHGRRRGEHVGHSGRRVGDVARAPVAAGSAETVVSPTATWWHSRRARSPTVTSARWAAPCRSATSPGADELFDRSNALWEKLVAACKPGAPASDLLAAYEAAGEPLPPMPVAHGLGLGFDPPVVSPDLPATSAEEHLDPGTVLAVTGYVWAQGVGAVYQRDAVLITADGAEVLTTSPSFSGQSSVGIG